MAKRALIVVRDLSGVAELAKRLVGEFGFDLWANAEAASQLRAEGIDCQEIAESEAAALVADRGNGIELVVANFLEVAAAGRGLLSWKKALATFDRKVVNIIREGAWAVERTLVVGNAADYEATLAALERGKGKVAQAFRMERAVAALRTVSEFEFAVAQYLEIQGGEAPDMSALAGFPKATRFVWGRAATLKSGENRHQQAALYGRFFEHFQQVSGEPLGYECVLNVSRAAYLIGEFEKPAAAVLRKGRIVAVVSGSEYEGVAQEILSRERIEGGWLVSNGTLSNELLDTIAEGKATGLLLPGVDEGQRERFKRLEGLKAVVATSGLGYEALQEITTVVGGALVQDRDRFSINPMEWQVLGLAQPLVEDWEQLLFGAKVARHLETSACVVLAEGRIVAMESARYSQPVAWQGVEKVGSGLTDTVAVFDEPVEDARLLTEMKGQGVRCLLCPSGPLDDAVRARANELGLVVLTMNRSLRRL